MEQAKNILKLKIDNFPSPYHDCYESSIMNILQYRGLPDELLLMCNHYYFVFDHHRPRVLSKLKSFQHAWQCIHGLEIKSCTITDQVNARQQLIDKLDSGMPVCLPVDIYFLPHTSHYQQLHLIHFLDIFGYNDSQYYIVSPYYRYKGWVDTTVIHDSLFSPVNSNRHLIYVPELRWKPLQVEEIHKQIRESCEYMLGLATPKESVDQDTFQLGLAGILSFSTALEEIAATSYKDLPINLLELSTQVIAIGYSRYWLQQMVQSFQSSIFSTETASQLDELFSIIIPAWRAIGIRLGAAIYRQDNDMIEKTARRVNELYEQEYKLFNYLLGAQPGYDKGSL